MAAFVATITLLLSDEIKAADGRQIVVEIGNFKFKPEAPSAKPGDVIVWINKDIVPHTVTAKDGSWDSGLIEAGGQWELVVTKETIPAYSCRFHPSMTAKLAKPL